MVVIPIPYINLAARQAVDPWEDEPYDTASIIKPPQQATDPPFSKDVDHPQVNEGGPGTDWHLEPSSNPEEHSSVIFESGSGPVHSPHEALLSNRPGPLSKGGQAGLGILLAFLGIAFVIMIIFKIGQWKHIWEDPIQMWKYMQEKSSRREDILGKFGFKRWRRRVGKRVARGEPVRNKQKRGSSPVPNITVEEVVYDTSLEPTARANVSYHPPHPWNQTNNDRNTSSHYPPGSSCPAAHPDQNE